MNENVESTKTHSKTSVGEWIMSISLILGILLGLTASFMSCNSPSYNEVNYNIIDQYSIIRQQVVNNYNALLDVQKSGVVVNVEKLDAHHNKIRNNYDNEYDKKLIEKFNQRLDYQNKTLIAKLKKNNAAIKNNTKVDYNSLKIVNNIKDNNELGSIITQSVNSRQNNRFVIRFWLFMFVCGIIVTPAEYVMEQYYSDSTRETPLLNTLKFLKKR